MSLNHSDIQAASKALRELYTHTDSATLPQHIVRLLHRLIPADSAVYNSFDFRTGEMQVVHDHGPDGDKYLPALNEHIQQHPLLSHLRDHWQDGAASLSDAISQRQLRDHPIYCEFFRHLGIERQVGLLVEDRQYGFVGVGLQRDGRDFSKRDKDVLTFFQPHIIQACKNAADITRTYAQNHSSERAMQVARIGIIRLTAASKIDWISRQAMNWLTTYFPGEPPFAGGALPAKLNEWLRQKQQVENKLRRSSQNTWQVTSERGLLFIRWIMDESGESHLVFSEQLSGVSFHELESLGLSPREAEVLHWIARGKANEAIAIILSTSRRTVDKQVENILRKLGVESRVGAAMLAAEHMR